MSPAPTRHAVHRGRMEAVEVNRVRVLGRVHEPDAHEVALRRAKRRTGDSAVEGPGREPDAGRDLDLLVLGDQRVLAEQAAARQAPCRSVVEVPQDLRRVEAVCLVVDDVAELERGALVPTAVGGGHALVALAGAGRR